MAGRFGVCFDMAVTHKAKLIDGRAMAARAKQEIAARVRRLQAEGRSVRLDAVLADGDSPASIYARNQGKGCRELGIEYVLHRLPADATHEDVAGRILLLNADRKVNAIMVNLPLPEGVDTERIQSLIDVTKDVEGVNPANIGRVVYGRRSLVPCTALAVMEMIESTGIKLAGTRCVCVGASNIVGKPIAILLMQAEATVISTNKYTAQLADLTRTGEVLVSATGVPGVIRAPMVKPGAVVIDVGMAPITDPGTGRDRLVGDVAFDEVSEVAAFVSPVPGGVGAMTVAMLLRNTTDAASRV